MDIDPELSEYVERFVADSRSGVEMRRLIIKLDTAMNEKYLGTCTIEESQHEVRINGLHWQTLTDSQKEMLMYHELGHCVLLRGHRTDVNPGDGRPESVMYPYAFNPQVYQEYRSAYVSELFSVHGGTSLRRFVELW